MTPRRVLFWSHLCVGVVVGAVIAFLAVTGMLLAFQPQILQWSERGSHIAHLKSASSCIAPSALLSAAYVDQKAIPTSIVLFTDPHQPAEVTFGQTVLLMNPCSGEILSRNAGKMRNFFSDVKDLHRWVAWRGTRHEGLRSIKNACDLCFLFLMLSGSILWLPRKWTRKHLRSAALLRGKLKGRARDWNLHNVFGLWMALPLAAIAWTGAIMAYPWANSMLYKAAGDAQTSRVVAERDSTKAPLPLGEYGTLDPAIHVAMAQDAHWHSLQMRMPGEKDKAISFSIDEGLGGNPQQRAQLTVARKTAEPLHWQPFSAESRGRRWRLYTRYIHTGELFGLAGQILAFFAALGALVLVWTGFALAIRRLGAWRSRNTSLCKKGLQMKADDL